MAREFLGYRARGAPDGPDDGTIAPWATLAGLPFAPEIVLPTPPLAAMSERYPPRSGAPTGVRGGLNPTVGWVCDAELRARRAGRSSS